MRNCSPNCIYFSCNSDVDDEKLKCTCDKYDIWITYGDLCQDYIGNRVPIHNDFTAKHDEGKLQIHLVPTQIIRDIAEVRMYGNAKYGDSDNWKTVGKWRYVDALLRHLLAYLDDPDGVDEESGIPHYKHAACNMAFICAMEENDEQQY